MIAYSSNCLISQEWLASIAEGYSIINATLLYFTNNALPYTQIFMTSEVDSTTETRYSCVIIRHIVFCYNEIFAIERHSSYLSNSIGLCIYETKLSCTIFSQITHRGIVILTKRLSVRNYMRPGNNLRNVMHLEREYKVALHLCIEVPAFMIVGLR